MDNVILGIIGATLFIAWLLIPVIVRRYQRIYVPCRYDEISDQFLRGAPPKETPLQDDPRGRTAAWHYSKLQNPRDEVKDEEEALRFEFDFYHNKERYASKLRFILILSGLMLALVGLWLADRLQVGTDAAAPNAFPIQSGVLGRIDTSIIMALLGAFVWSLYEVLSRRKSGDLTPVELYDVIVRFITAVPIGYAFSLLVFDKVSPWLAFVASAFPLRDLRQLIRKQALRKIGETPTPRTSVTSQTYIGQVLSDIGEETIVRLEELDIVTCMDLAYTDPVKLMIKTGAPIQLVLAWIDKALLAVYAAPHIRELERLGMPCALDVCEFYVTHCWNLAEQKERENWRENAAVIELSTRLNVSRELLVPQMLRTLFLDLHTQFLVRAWFGPATKPDRM